MSNFVETQVSEKEKKCISGCMDYGIIHSLLNDLESGIFNGQTHSKFRENNAMQKKSSK